MAPIRQILEPKLFGVCAWIGDMLGMPSNLIRLYFIYATFLTFGSPIIVYLVLAFWMNVSSLWRRKRRSSIWDL
jgi:phage shock protein C